jgi:Na+-transporting NADH:ubiquinone oxidoreductase subunit NqrB
MKVAAEPASVRAPAFPAQPLASDVAGYHRRSRVAPPDSDLHAAEASSQRRARPPRSWDPRLYQSATLGSALVYGILWLDLEVRLVTAAAIIGTALLTQLVCMRLTGRPPFDPRSALISANSLCLLLRTDWVVLAMLAAVVAIASKFTLKVRGKHVFNPTNFALVVMMLATGEVWVSPGQWGSGAVFAFLLASAGGLVVSRAGRTDVTFTFLAAWAVLLFGRSLWLGEPLAIPLHRMENGALVVFAFFMISDPRTTPDSRAGRMLFAVLVALGAYLVQFWLFRTNGLLWSLAVCSLAVPLIDYLLPGPRYEWNAGAGNAQHERGSR